MTTTPPHPDDEPSVPDDVWDRFVGDTEASIRASAPKEPSARARMVTERLRQQDALAAREAKRSGRAAKTAARQAQPEAWRAGPDPFAEAVRRPRRRRRGLGILGVLMAVAAVLVLLNPGAALSWLRGDRADSSGQGLLPPETARPTAPPSEKSFPGTPTREAPFAGSPAERYAQGAAGIVPPEAKAVGWMTREQVATSLKQAKAFLVSGNIDPATLRGARPEAALALVDPSQGGIHSLYDVAFKKPDKKHDPLWIASRFDPSEVRVLGNAVRTHGRMTFEEGEQGALAVHADYTFVYPLIKADGGSREVARTVVRRVIDFEVPNPERYRVTKGMLYISDYDQEISNSACFVDDGFLHPAFGSDAGTGARGTGAPVDPYDRSRDLTSGPGEGCRSSSRT
ncbi:hypothetical protein ACFWVC_03345 [Streptomyces sp. NPDC058691]|uniref:hypothetical protein n=1 Tax=Streptomyces sp. NPDC058691 TaxID=3346601 RepID=UPI00364F1599